MLSQGQYKIEYTPTGISFAVNVQGNEFSFVINDIDQLRQLVVIIETFIKQHSYIIKG